jgi:hypothetical protein
VLGVRTFAGVGGHVMLPAVCAWLLAVAVVELAVVSTATEYNG